MFKSLPKRFEMDGRAVPYFYDETHITNGHWIIPRELLKDSFRYCYPCESQPDIQRLIPLHNPKTYRKTNRLYSFADTYAREFTCDGELIYFREDYVAFFDIKVIKGKNPEDVCITENGIVLMPMRPLDYKVIE